MTDEARTLIDFMERLDRFSFNTTDDAKISITSGEAKAACRAFQDVLLDRLIGDQKQTQTQLNVPAHIGELVCNALVESHMYGDHLKAFANALIILDHLKLNDLDAAHARDEAFRSFERGLCDIHVRG